MLTANLGMSGTRDVAMMTAVLSDEASIDTINFSNMDISVNTDRANLGRSNPATNIIAGIEQRELESGYRAEEAEGEYELFTIIKEEDESFPALPPPATSLSPASHQPTTNLRDLLSWW